MHRGQWRGYQDVGPAVKRFDYMDRMGEEEADQHAAARQRAEAARRSLPPIAPDQVVEMGGSRFAVYSGEKAVQMRQREALVKQARDGARR